MTQRPMVTVSHDGIKGTAVVPRSALPRMKKQGWREAKSSADSEPTAPQPPAQGAPDPKEK